MGKIYVLGMGPGAVEYIVPAVKEAAGKCDVFMGGTRHLEVFSYMNKETIAISEGLQRVRKYIEDNIRKKNIGILASGDPGLYGILKFVKREFPYEEIKVIPGISSLQYLFSAIGRPWEGFHIASLHGRQKSIIPVVKKYRRVVLFTDGNNPPDKIARELVQGGLSTCKMVVGEKLSYLDERITADMPEDIAGKKFDALSVVVIEYGD